MNIDITEESADAIIEILDTHPNGHLEIKYERAFWCSDHTDTKQRATRRPYQMGPSQSRPQGQGQSVANFSKGALDALGSIMGPPMGRR